MDLPNNYHEIYFKLLNNKKYSGLSINSVKIKFVISNQIRKHTNSQQFFFSMKPICILYYKLQQNKNK